MAFTNSLTAREICAPMLLGFTGDISLNGTARSNPFADLRSLPPQLRLFINLESPFQPPGRPLTPARQKILLSAPPETREWLQAIPTSIVCLGNNHIADYGNEIARFTLEHLGERFPTFGAGCASDAFHRYILDEGELRIGFLSYCCSDTKPLLCSSKTIGPRPFVLDSVVSDISELKAQVHHVVAVLHWGDEHMHYPRPAQQTAARQLIERGVDLVVGSHSHTVQGYECYKGRYIFYSLGNFFFPDVFVNVGGRDYECRFSARNRWGLLPIVEFRPSGYCLRAVHIVEQGCDARVAIVTQGARHGKLRRLCRTVTKPGYERTYATRHGLERLVARVAEFAARPNKPRILARKMRRILARQRDAN